MHSGCSPTPPRSHALALALPPPPSSPAASHTRPGVGGPRRGSVLVPARLELLGPGRVSWPSRRGRQPRSPLLQGALLAAAAHATTRSRPARTSVAGGVQAIPQQGDGGMNPEPGRERAPSCAQNGRSAAVRPAHGSTARRSGPMTPIPDKRTESPEPRGRETGPSAWMCVAAQGGLTQRRTPRLMLPLHHPRFKTTAPVTSRGSARSRLFGQARPQPAALRLSLPELAGEGREVA